jgi:hypothetical protein
MHPLAQQDPMQEASITFNAQPGDLYGIQRQHRDSHSTSRGDFQATSQFFKAESVSNIIGIRRVRDWIQIVVRDWIQIVVRDWIQIVVRDWIQIVVRDWIQIMVRDWIQIMVRDWIQIVVRDWIQIMVRDWIQIMTRAHISKKYPPTQLACKGVYNPTCM